MHLNILNPLLSLTRNTNHINIKYKVQRYTFILINSSLLCIYYTPFTFKSWSESFAWRLLLLCHSLSIKHRDYCPLERGIQSGPRAIQPTYLLAESQCQHTTKTRRATTIRSNWPTCYIHITYIFPARKKFLKYVKCQGILLFYLLIDQLFLDIFIYCVHMSAVPN